MNAEFVANLPMFGRVDFDFSGETRPGPDVVVIRDGYLVKILAELGLIKNDDASKAETLRELLHVKHVSNHTLKGDGRVVYECSMDTALEIDNHHGAFYDNLSLRAESFAQASKLEDLITTYSISERITSTVKKPKPSASKVLSLGVGLELKFDSSKESENVAQLAPLSYATPRNPAGLVTPSKTMTTIKKRNAEPLPSIPPSDETPSTLIPLTGLLHGSPLRPNVSNKQEGNKTDSVKTQNNYATPSKNLSQVFESKTSVKLDGKSESSKDNRFKLDGSTRSSKESKEGSKAAIEGAPVLSPVDPSTVQMVKPGMLNLELELPAHPAWLESDDGDDQNSTSDSDSDEGNIDEDYEFEQNTKGQIKYNVHNKCSVETIEYLKSIFNNENASPQAKLKRLLDAIEETVAAVHWMMARHVALILTCVEKLPFGLTEKTKYFGNYRVEIVVLLFGHIVDLHNFELVLRVLKPFEIACVIARIGWLNFINPMKPEGAYGLDLTKWDQRMIAKILIVLETHEPGENWTKKKFRWTLDSSEIPGWILTQPWLTGGVEIVNYFPFKCYLYLFIEEGLPNRGILDVAYFSGEGARKNGCVALPKFRKSLLYLTLLEEHEIVEEEHRAHQSMASGMQITGNGEHHDVGLTAIKMETGKNESFIMSKC